jgi:hypothetical protein
MEILSPADLMSKPRLTISISATKMGAFGLMVAFAEPAFLERDRTIRVQAATWVKEGVSIGIEDQGVRDLFKDIVDAFIIDWLIENPRTR